MKKSMLLSFVVLGIVVWSGCRGKKIENQWTSQEIIVDGKSEDWEAAPLTYAKETNMAMGVTNNAENIYVMFRLNDPGTARRIQKMGFTVWLNKDGKKKKTFGINYRGSSGMQHELKPVEVPSEMGGGTRPDRMKAMMERFSVDLPDFGKIRLIENGEERDIPENNLEGPAAGFALSNGYYCYEFRMPIPINVELGTEVKLCMELGGLTDENMKKIREEIAKLIEEAVQFGQEAPLPRPEDALEGLFVNP